MSERVSIYGGKVPIIIIAPHAPEEPGTDIIAKTIIDNLDCCGIINNGWNKSKLFDYDSEQADCNNIEHLHKEVLVDEFLVPLIKLKTKLSKSHTTIYMFTIHGIGQDARDYAKDQALDMIVGYGAGHPPSYTCNPWRKNLFMYLIEASGLVIYESKPRSKYAARNKKNITQIFNMDCWYPDLAVQSMQLQIIEDLRLDKPVYTGEFLADIIDELSQWSSWNAPSSFHTKLF